MHRDGNVHRARGRGLWRALEEANGIGRRVQGSVLSGEEQEEGQEPEQIPLAGHSRQTVRMR